MTVDIGISREEPLYLFQVAQFLRDGLILVSGPLVDAVADILPIDATVTHGELHLGAAGQDGHQQARTNGFQQRVRLSSLGEPTRRMGESLGYAAELPGALVEREAAELVVDAVEYWALVSGFLDPTAGIAELRGQMGLTVSSG